MSFDPKSNVECSIGWCDKEYEKRWLQWLHCENTASRVKQIHCVYHNRPKMDFVVNETNGQTFWKPIEKQKTSEEKYDLREYLFHNYYTSKFVNFSRIFIVYFKSLEDYVYTMSSVE